MSAYVQKYGFEDNDVWLFDAEDDLYYCKFKRGSLEITSRVSAAEVRASTKSSELSDALKAMLNSDMCLDSGSKHL